MDIFNNVVCLLSMFMKCYKWIKIIVRLKDSGFF